MGKNVIACLRKTFGCTLTIQYLKPVKLADDPSILTIFTTDPIVAGFCLFLDPTGYKNLVLVQDQPSQQ